MWFYGFCHLLRCLRFRMELLLIKIAKKYVKKQIKLLDNCD